MEMVWDSFTKKKMMPVMLQKKIKMLLAAFHPAAMCCAMLMLIPGIVCLGLYTPIRLQNNQTLLRARMDQLYRQVLLVHVGAGLEQP